MAEFDGLLTMNDVAAAVFGAPVTSDTLVVVAMTFWSTVNLSSLVLSVVTDCAVPPTEKVTVALFVMVVSDRVPVAKAGASRRAVPVSDAVVSN